MREDKILRPRKKDGEDMAVKPWKKEGAPLPREGRQGEFIEKSRWGVELALSRWHLLTAALLLAAAGAFFLLEKFQAEGEQPAEQVHMYGWYAAAYLLLTLLGAALCLIEFRIPHLARRAFGWILLALAPLGTFYAVDLINGTRILTFPFRKAFANYLCYLMVFAAIYALCRRVWVTIFAGGAAFLTFGIANYFVVQFRGQPILPWDLQSVSTAMAVSGGYEYTPTQQMALAAISFLCFTVFSSKAGPQGRGTATRRFRMGERLTAMCMSIGLFFLLFPANILSSMGISVWAWNQKVSSELTGIVAGFFANVQFVMVEKPEGYSTQAVKALGEGLSEKESPSMLGSPGKPPTIIAIMNESMTDFSRVGDMSFTPDNLPFLHSLEESGQVVWGTAYSSVYGGNTCNSEYEFLTGNTTAFLPVSSKPYQQYIDHDQAGLPSILKSYGYRCVAVHPGKRSAWQRDEAYPYLGFDEFIDASAFDVPRRYEHGLTSDRSCYDQVVFEYENRGSQPLFLFNVTIQNHGGYEDEEYETTVQLTDKPGKYPQAEQYLSLTKKSDESLEFLLDYFAKQEDPVVVLFFGDHWPNLEPGFVEDLLGADDDAVNIETMMRKYQVPFFLWANYPLQGEEIEGISLNYLSGLLLRAAGLEGTAYTKFLEGLRETLPVITAVGMIDREGKVYKNEGETPYGSLLNDYAMLQYNHAFEEEGRQDGLFEVEGSHAYS